MKRQLLFIASIVSFIFLVGCSTNEINIENQTDGKVTFIFRGEEHEIPSGKSKPIDRIPDGTFSYSVVFDIPATANGYSLPEASEYSLKFVQHNTDWQIYYSSVIDTSGAYIIYETKSSSIPNEELE